MGTSDILQLVWDNHLANVSSLFQTLYQEHKLVDVTLACRDGHLRAHKLILSACSPFFERIFQENPCDHPVVIVRGVYYQEMQTLLDYIYKGRINIAANLVNDLMCVASDLEIKGFENFRKISGINGNDASSRMNRDNTFYQVQKPCPSSFVTTVMPKIKIKKQNALNEYGHGDQTTDDEDELSSEDESDNAELVCHVCYYKTRNRNDFLLHSKAHEKLRKEFKCEFCPSSFARSSHLARHRRSHTGERPFTCYCGKTYARQDKLRNHIKLVHNLGSSGGQMSQTTFMSNGLQLMATSKAKQKMEPKLSLKQTLSHSLLPQTLIVKTDKSTLVPGMTPLKRKRGRPRKEKLPVSIGPKRPRGRPRKVPPQLALFQKQEEHMIPIVKKEPVDEVNIINNANDVAHKFSTRPPSVECIAVEAERMDLRDSGSNPATIGECPPKVNQFIDYDPLLMEPQSAIEYASTISQIGDCSLTINPISNSVG